MTHTEPATIFWFYMSGAAFLASMFVCLLTNLVEVIVEAKRNARRKDSHAKV